MRGRNRPAARSAQLPAPTGGWDTRNALADMPVENAVVLDNWFPGTDRVTVRKGYTSHATGMSGDVETILSYNGVNGANKIFAANGGALYDVSNSGAVGAAASSGYSNNRFQQVQIGTSGGQFLFAVNGEDAPISYDGSSWTNPSISASGLTVANLIWCNVHHRRLWFGEKDSLTAWYLAVNAIAGTPASFPLYGLAGKGGYIMAMGTWSRDGGAGPDDATVFLTSEGQAIVYEGTDPASANTWSLNNVFDIGRPIGRRCMVKWGGELIMITEDGFVPASALLADRSSLEKFSVSSQINKAVNDAVRDYSTQYGWQAVVYPEGTMLIFNIPQGSSKFHQYVFNTLTQKPCRFTGIDAVCWGLKGNEAYFGKSDGTVHKFDSGNSDNGTAIVADALPAFHTFKTPAAIKFFKRVEPLFQSNGNPNAALDLNVDYQVRASTAVASASVTSAAKWGIGKWGIGTWGSANQVYRGWRGIRGKGRSAALRVRISTTSARPSWIATNFTYIPGGQV